MVKAYCSTFFENKLIASSSDSDIDKSVSLEKISECSKIDIKELRSYNPEIKQGVIPPLKEKEVYQFRLPLTADSKFDSLFALLEEERI